MFYRFSGVVKYTLTLILRQEKGDSMKQDEYKTIWFLFFFSKKKFINEPSIWILTSSSVL